jgi:putative phosphoribosyl transferase
VIVLGLPRGGVPVAYEIAIALRVLLDVFVVRKLGVPGFRELAMGAIARGGVRVLNEHVVRSMSIPEVTLNEVAAEELQELKRRELAYRGHGGSPDAAGKIVILVDDGIATGSTIRAAVAALKRQHPARLIVAVPTAAASTCDELRSQFDEFVVLMAPEDFRSVGEWYADFSQTTDDEVTTLLRKAAESVRLGEG